jgi:tRNA pseudouridine65 synthase
MHEQDGAEAGGPGEPQAGGPEVRPQGRRSRPRDIVRLAQGDGWIVVAKPPRVITHRNWAHRHERAAVQRVRDLVGGRVYPIHRLDRSASGCLLFATDRARAGALQAALVAGQKEYIAFVRGELKQSGPIRVETPMKDDRGLLKEAASVVERLGASADPRCSLLRVRPETGRFHQVRRHVRDLNHPIIGDGDHGDSRINRWWRENHAMGRLGLHALRMSLDLGGGERIEAVCPLFADHYAVFSGLPFWDEAVAACPALGLPVLAVNGRGFAQGGLLQGVLDGPLRDLNGLGAPTAEPAPWSPISRAQEAELDRDMVEFVDLDALPEHE